MKTIGLARLGRDAELRRTPGGDAVCNLSLAVNYGMKAQDGNRPTQWIDASLWGKQAEALAPYLLKGSVHCFTLSDVHIETYQGQNGEGHKLAARVDNVELGPNGNTGGSRAPAPAPAPAQQGDGFKQRPAASPPASRKFDDMDDDIPF